MGNITTFQLEEMQRRLSRGRGEPETPVLEKKIHEEIMEYCDKQWPRWKYVHSRMDKRTRNAVGTPDFVIALPGDKTIYVEAKRPGEKLSPAQQAYAAEMKALGTTVYVVHNMAEFLETILMRPASQGYALTNPLSVVKG